MRTFLLSLALILFASACSEERNQITQPQQDRVISSSALLASAESDCVSYDFDEVEYSEDVRYDSYGILTFWASVRGGNDEGNGFFTYRGGSGLIIKFPEPNVYNDVAFDISSWSVAITVFFSNGTSKGGLGPVWVDRAYRFTYTAPAGLYLSAVRLDNGDDSFTFDNFQLCTLSDECPAPEVTLEASILEIWPANNKEREVVFSGSVINECGTTNYELTDEYGEYSYTGEIVPGGFSIPLNLMATRTGKDKDGRKYSFTVTSENNSGTVLKSVDLIVPHDRRK